MSDRDDYLRGTRRQAVIDRQTLFRVLLKQKPGAEAYRGRIQVVDVFADNQEDAGAKALRKNNLHRYFEVDSVREKS